MSCVFDVRNIILKYIHPKSLIPFFITHSLNFNTKFIFDAQYYELNICTANMIFGMFPNIILNGIHIIQIDNDLYKLYIPFKNLLYVKLCGISNEYPEDTIGYDDYENYDDFEILQNMPNIITLIIENIIFDVENYIYECQKLHNLVIKNNINDNIYLNLNNLYKCSSLKNIMCDINYGSVENIKNCNKLKKLELYVHLCYDPPFFKDLETCKKLKSLKLHYYQKLCWNVNAITSVKYDNLRYVDMNITNDWELEILTRCKKLRCVKIEDTRLDLRFSNVLSFNNCQNITHIDISNYRGTSLRSDQIKNLRTVVINSKQNKPDIENVEIIVVNI